MSSPQWRPVRIGHREREDAVTALGEHFAQGRLDADEFDERVARAYAARTSADLQVLFEDLPRPVAPVAPPPGRFPPPDPHAPYGREPRTGMPYSDRSKVVAGLLQLFLGWAGVGRFYTGHTGIAVAQLVVTLFTFGLGAVWGFVDGIVLLAGRPTDPAGRPLRS